MPATQKQRLIGVASPLGEDVLLFRQMQAVEPLGRLFEFQLDLLSEQEVAAPALLGEMMTVWLELAPEQYRYFNGVVSRFAYTGSHGRYLAYQATLQPWLWFLTRTADCRIFQNQAVPDIVQGIFREHGFSDFEVALSGQYAPREYCVQYRETDFNFVSRLMEEEGIYYYFKHQEDKHLLVLADGYGSHQPIVGETIPYFWPEVAESGQEDQPDQRDRERERETFDPNRQTPLRRPESANRTSDTTTRTAAGSEQQGQSDDEELGRHQYVFDWSVAQQVQPGAYALSDFDFEAPKKKLLSKLAQPQSHSRAEYEVYDYPGAYTQLNRGQASTTVRLQELQAQYQLVKGRSNARALAAGGLFTLAEHPLASQNREYLAVSTVIELRSDAYESTGLALGVPNFMCDFTALDAQQPYRPARITPKPVVQGPQTAIVVGKAGEEIWTDQYGRVKCQFHWDRYGQSDENSSCWIRVSHPWAGKGWGAIAIPRIGQEVIVDFLEGDPDCPIITGRVYNGANMPPYGLPANQTQSGIKSRSSKGGGTADFNEIRLEDKKGEEQLFIHAQKNQDIEVENNETHWVGNDRTKTIDHDETTHVKHDRTETVDNNETISIGVDRTETVGSNETISIGGNRIEQVAQNENITVAMNRTRQVGISENITIGATRTTQIGINDSIDIGNNLSESVGSNQSTNVGSNQSTDVGKNRSAQVGQNDSLQVGKNLTIAAGDQISITTGKASIVMKKDGTIMIQGKNITINGSGKINVKASNDVTVKGKNILEN